MLDQGRILRVGTRKQFDEIRLANPELLEDRELRLIHQFLNGAPTGPLTDSDGTSLYEKILVNGEDSSMFHR
ncbi:MAG: hypothetical protein KKI02_12690, partial [Planctomycetes bacterium]|nr:hypothetical protein [Planctomycetota bacterium]